MKRTSISLLSPRRKKQVNAYLKFRKKFLEANPICQVCTQQSANQIHHKKGRLNELLNLSIYFLPVCQTCHTKIETNRIWAREMGYSLDRIGI